MTIYVENLEDDFIITLDAGIDKKLECFIDGELASDYTGEFNEIKVVSFTDYEFEFLTTNEEDGFIGEKIVIKISGQGMIFKTKFKCNIR